MPGIYGLPTRAQREAVREEPVAWKGAFHVRSDYDWPHVRTDPKHKGDRPRREKSPELYACRFCGFGRGWKRSHIKDRIVMATVFRPHRLFPWLPKKWLWLDVLSCKPCLEKLPGVIPTPQIELAGAYRR